MLFADLVRTEHQIKSSPSNQQQNSFIIKININKDNCQHFYDNIEEGIIKSFLSHSKNVNDFCSPKI